jgi:Trypsin-like peptidase domain
MLHIIRAAIASGFCFFACAEAEAVPALPLDMQALRVLPVAPVVVFGAHPRLTAEQFASENHLDLGDVKRRHAASGVIHCGNARGAGQLTLTDSVITTAAHVLFDEHGQLRGDNAHCFFTATVADQEVTTAIDMASVVSGNKDPYSKPAVHDWAVARLLRPVKGATPYGLGAPAQAAEDIRFVARGHSDWGSGRIMSMENCRLHDALSSGAEGTREFSFDCDAGVGASGGAVLNASGGRLLAVFVGYRSVAPDNTMPFSAQHYNFAVTLEGAFRRAVEAAAGGSATAAR